MTALIRTPRTGFHGAETEVRGAPGIRTVHVGHPPEQQIDAHWHDWACLTVFRCGSYTEQIAAGEVTIDGPGVAFHPRGQQHGNRIGSVGLETMSFLFDERLLVDAIPARVLREGRIWRGGLVARSAQSLVRNALHPAADPVALVSRFLQSAFIAPTPARAPSWLAAVRGAISVDAISTAGFCDQSHMVRSFHAVLGRAPNAVRAVSYRVA